MFEPKSHFISRWSIIVRVTDNLCGSRLQSQSELYHVSSRY